MFRLTAPSLLLALVACTGLGARLPDAVARNRARAAWSWVAHGTCDHHQLVRCESGERLLIASDGFVWEQSAWSPRGDRVAYAAGGCVGPPTTMGTMPACPEATRVVLVDLCVDALDGLERRGVSLVVSCRTLGKTVRLNPGSTSFELSAGVKLRAELPVATQPFDVWLDAVPPGVRVSQCESASEGCRALTPGAQLESPELLVERASFEPEHCTLWVERAFFTTRAASDAGVAGAQ